MKLISTMFIFIVLLLSPVNDVELQQDSEEGKVVYIVSVDSIDQTNLAIFKNNLEFYLLRDGEYSQADSIIYDEQVREYVEIHQKLINDEFIRSLDFEYNLIYQSKYSPVFYIELSENDVHFLCDNIHINLCDIMNEKSDWFVK